MKRLIALLLVVVLSVVPLSISVSAAEVDVTDENVVELDVTGPETASVQPRLNGTRTLTLGNAWVDVKVENNWLDATLTVTNHTTSAYKADVRVVSTDYQQIIVAAKSIDAGSSASFGTIPHGGYIIQAKSSDDVEREYTLSFHD